MTLVEHLQELRHRIVVSLVAVFIGAVIGFIWYQEAPFGMDPLGEILRKPYCSLPPEMRLSFGEDGECRLLATSPFEMLMLRMKIGALAGTVLSSPVWLYQIWAFIVPGLHKKERRVTIIFVASAVSLFVAGAVLAYFILAVGLEFLVGIGSEFQTAALTGEKYFYYLLAMLLIFGVSFEIPLLIITLNIVGILEYRHIKSKRRLIFVVVMIFAAVVTPGQDVFTMIVLACALELLMEASFQFCRINDKRRKRERPDWMDMDDEQASALGEAPGGIQAPTPVSAPSSVQASPSPRTVRPANAEHSAPVAQRDIAKQPPAGGLFDDVL
ncbi:twin-arginine translocase subunit TatC [Corynebacterium sp.]|uniref:twin-arginine translocase subunit TatC n=1 Tax=Corynebacterium sp. TaxID=1720 RepID=UPI0026DB33F4|nr:twin-arginine translocase subunit TatC [Corynebacterium sp.]MDO5031597.1 twin-arginine translocase subunit TatC [Corynebacterium sp.]